MSLRARVCSALRGFAGFAVAWAAVIAATGGFSVNLGFARVNAYDPFRPLLVALACVAVSFLLGGRQEGRRFAGSTRRTLVALPGALRRRLSWWMVPGGAIALAVFIVGVRYGAFAAGGSDSYAYVSSARLLAAGHSLHVVQPFASALPWPAALDTLTPLGYAAGRRGGDIVPTYPLGLPLVMAGFMRAFGDNGPFYVSPVLGALAVWLAFALGVRLTSRPAVGLAAAVVLATSPPFVFSLLAPMSDVPATALWTLALWLALSDSTAASGACGAAAGLAVLVRPNLAPVGAIVGVSLVWRAVRVRGVSWRALTSVVAFGAPFAAALVAIALINKDLYGSPWRTGYGSLRNLYALANVGPNVRQFVTWLAQARSLYILAGTGAALLAWPRVARSDRARGATRLLLGGFVAAIWLSYLVYTPFDAWWYLRFLLPIWPVTIVLAAALALDVLTRLRAPAPGVWLAALALAFAAAGYQSRATVEAYNQKGEQRYAQAGRYVAAATPPRAALLTMQHSGSIRYYSDRVSIRYDSLDRAWLDRGVDALIALGYHPYALMDDWELPSFRRRFRGQALGGLEWEGVEVAPGTKLYDLQQFRLAQAALRAAAAGTLPIARPPQG